MRHLEANGSSTSRKATGHTEVTTDQGITPCCASSIQVTTTRHEHFDQSPKHRAVQVQYSKDGRDGLHVCTKISRTCACSPHSLLRCLLSSESTNSGPGTLKPTVCSGACSLLRVQTADQGKLKLTPMICCKISKCPHGSQCFWVVRTRNSCSRTRQGPFS